MGNSESANPVRNMDKRTARREYCDDFAAAILRYRQRSGYSISKKVDVKKLPIGSLEWVDGAIRVFVRKRPIFSHELENSEFDTITCLNSQQVVVHDARMHNDMKRQLMNHHEFTFDQIFHEQMSNEDVYRAAARPLVRWACQGGYATAFVYGQTGSGKSYTMGSIYHQACLEIFSHLDREAAVVSVSFVEIAGESVSDLLNSFTACQLATASDGSGSVHPYPVVEVVVEDAEQLWSLIQHGCNLRSTAATGVHNASSRSHALLRIYIQHPATMVEGTLTLVDLAGSEHKIDSMYHDVQRRRETSHINASLMALKDCIRARSSGSTTAMQHVYRRSKLTLALKNSFELPGARTIVIATVSPASKDTEHSLNTLRHACLMHGLAQGQGDEGQEGGQGRGETRFITGGRVITEAIGSIDVTALAKRNQAQRRLSGNGQIADLKTSNGNDRIDSQQPIGLDRDGSGHGAAMERIAREKKAAKQRRAIEMKSFKALSAPLKARLKTARLSLRDENGRQVQRLRSMGVGGVVAIGGGGVVPTVEEQGDEEQQEEEDYEEGFDEQEEEEEEEEGEVKSSRANKETSSSSSSKGAGNSSSSRPSSATRSRPPSSSSSSKTGLPPSLSRPSSSGRLLPTAAVLITTRGATAASSSSSMTPRMATPQKKRLTAGAATGPGPASTPGRPISSRIVAAIVQQQEQPHPDPPQSQHRPSGPSIESIVEAIYLARGQVAENILQQQLQAMLRLHGYPMLSVQEIHSMLPLALPLPMALPSYSSRPATATATATPTSSYGGRYDDVPPELEQQPSPPVIAAAASSSSPAVILHAHDYLRGSGYHREEKEENDKEVMDSPPTSPPRIVSSKVTTATAAMTASSSSSAVTSSRRAVTPRRTGLGAASSSSSSVAPSTLAHSPPSSAVTMLARSHSQQSLGAVIGQQQQQQPITTTANQRSQSKQRCTAAIAPSSSSSSSSAMAVAGSLAIRSTSSSMASTPAVAPPTVDKDRDPVLLAKQRLEEEVRLKTERQQAARLYRQQQLTQTGGKLAIVVEAAIDRPAKSQSQELSEEENQRSYHLAEIARLSSLLDGSAVGEEVEKEVLSQAKKFSVKKQLALHKAQILKLQRAKIKIQQQEEGQVADGRSASPPLPTAAQQRQRQLVEQQQREAEERRREQQQEERQRLELLQREEEEQLQPVGGRTAAMRVAAAGGAAGAGRVPIAVAAAGSGGSNDGLYLVSAQGRPLSTRMAEQIYFKQQQHQQVQQVGRVGEEGGEDQVIAGGSNRQQKQKQAAAVRGYHIEERTSYDSSTNYERTVMQPAVQSQQPASRPVLISEEDKSNSNNLTPSNRRRQQHSFSSRNVSSYM